MVIQEAFPGSERVKSFVPLGVERPQHLSAAEISQFNEKGYICPLDVFSRAESLDITQYFDGLLERALAKGWNSYGLNGWHSSCPHIHDLVTDTRILDYVGDLLGPDLVCWGTHYFAKLPGDGKRVSWHQDASFWPLTPSKTVTVGWPLTTWILRTQPCRLFLAHTSWANCLLNTVPKKKKTFWIKP